MDDLLPFYERELTFLRRDAREFAQRYPKIAGRLLMAGDAVEDPHVERLMEGFALLTARIHKKLDDDYPEFTEALFQSLYPHYLRPFPSCSIARFDMGSGLAQLTSATGIPRGTELNTRPIRGIACRFKTTYDMQIQPVLLHEARYENVVKVPAGVHVASPISACITFDFSSASDAVSLSACAGPLRFFVDGEASLVTAILNALFTHTAGVAVESASGQWQMLSPDVIHAVGFAANETLIDYDARSHAAYRLLTEYFAFPEKFNFFDLGLDQIAALLPSDARQARVRVLLSGIRHDGHESRLLERLTRDNFLLHCTPVVNLFRQAAEPIRLSHATSSYPVIADSRRAHAFEIFSVDSVLKVQQTPQGERMLEYRPFYALRHGETVDGTGRYWHMSRNETVAERSPGFEYEMAIVDIDFDPSAEQTEVLSIALTCTNRDLPSQMPYGQVGGDLFMEGGGIAKTVFFLRKPTPTYRFERGKGAHWRLISHLSLNHLSLVNEGVEALREMFKLYDLPRSATNQKLIDSVISVEHRAATTRMAGNPFPTFVRGSEIRLVVDEDALVGSGLHLFAQVLDHFFGLYVHANSFSRLVLVSAVSGQEILKCKPRNGQSILV